MYHGQKLGIGITTALASAFFLSIMNIIAKILVEDIDPIMVTFWRNFSALTILMIWFVAMNKTSLMKTDNIRMQIIRAVIGTTGLTLAVWALSLLPVTEVVVMGFTSPLFVVLLAYPLLREKVGPYRILATLFGFIGIITIVGFDHGQLNPMGVIVALGFSLCNALVLIMLRQLGKTEHALTTTFYFLLIGLLMSAAYMPFSEKIIPDNGVWWAAGFIGVVGLMSLICKAESFCHAPASVIAPLAYTMLLWTAFFDFILWHRLAPTNIWIGAGIIILSNIFILWREHKQARINKSHLL